MRTTTLLASVLVWLSAGAAAALSVTPTPSGVAGPSLYQSENKSYTQGNWETGIWLPVSGPPSNLKASGDVTWSNGVAQNFTLTLNAALDTLSFSVGGTTISTAYAGGAHNAIQLGGRTTQNANTTASSFALSNLVLDGTALSNGFSGSGNGSHSGWIESASLLDGYTLTGTATFAWTGERPKNSNLAFNFYGTNVVPEPGTALLLGAGLAGLAVSGRKRTS
jgi:hypothetical protein